MKTCLAKFHHTEFTDSQGTMRRINVELTAGGGGKTKERQDKIKEKNRKLNEERVRRMVAEEEAKKTDGGAKKVDVESQKEQEEREEGWIHPSRRAHVPGRRY